MDIIIIIRPLLSALGCFVGILAVNEMIRANQNGTSIKDKIKEAKRNGHVLKGTLVEKRVLTVLKQMGVSTMNCAEFSATYEYKIGNKNRKCVLEFANEPPEEIELYYEKSPEFVFAKEEFRNPVVGDSIYALYIIPCLIGAIPLFFH